MNRLLLAAALFLLAPPAWAAAPAPIKIGETLCYTGCPEGARTWRDGWELALDEINAAGGVLGAPLEVVSRDNKGDPAEVVKNMEELETREGVKIVFGTLLSHVGLAASNYAKQHQLLFFRGINGSNELTGVEGHNLYFQLGAPMSAFTGPLAESAAKSGKKHWAFVAPNYVLGRFLVENFQEVLKRLHPNVSFADTQWYPLGKMNAGAIAQILGRENPDGIFVFAMASDYARFVREGTKRHLFDGRLVVGPVCGASEYIKPLGKEAPVGWLSAQGYPVEQITDPVHRKFIDAFQKRFGMPPDIGAFLGYSSLKILADAVRTAGSDDPHKVADVLRSQSFFLPDGPVTFRADGVSSHGTWVGTTGFYNGTPTILNPAYIKPDAYMPSVEENLKAREQKRTTP